VAGVTQPDGTVWDFGQFADVQDEYADITGNFLIKSVEYSVDIRLGTRTRMTFVPPDAYQVKAEPPPESVRSANTGTNFQNKEPITQPESLR
jgi:prophage tail gpP-like protein